MQLAPAVAVRCLMLLLLNGTLNNHIRARIPATYVFTQLTLQQHACYTLCEASCCNSDTSSHATRLTSHVTLQCASA